MRVALPFFLSPSPAIRGKENVVKTRRIIVCSLLSAVVLACAVGMAKIDRPWHNGSVWDIGFIRVKPGMDEAYLKYLAGEWKQRQEALKKEGVILSYKVISTKAHTVADWNLMLLTEFKDLASMEANQDKAEEISEKVGGDDQKQMQGYKDRLDIREVVGSRLAREVILEPKAK